MQHEPLDKGQGESKFESLMRRGTTLQREGKDLTQIRTVFIDDGEDPEIVKYVIGKLSDLEYEKKAGPSTFAAIANNLAAFALVVGGIGWFIWMFFGGYGIGLISTIPLIIAALGTYMLRRGRT